MKLIIGLGNPGKKYQKNRHNIGFMVVDELAKQLNLNWQLSTKFNAEIAKKKTNTEQIILAKPMTFMNSSGQAVQLISQYYKINSQDIIVIHDEKDLNFGQYKIQTNRGPAGHNGVKSIIDYLKTQDFTRIRIGIANKSKNKIPLADFVLSNFSLFERIELKKIIKQITDYLTKTYFNI